MLVSNQSLTHCSHSAPSQEQTGIRHWSLTTDQFTLLTQDIEDNFSEKKMDDTVWQHGLTCKLLRSLPDRHVVRMIIEMVMVITASPLPPEMAIGAGYDTSRMVSLEPLLFHICISDLPTI